MFTAPTSSQYLHVYNKVSVWYSTLSSCRSFKHNLSWCSDSIRWKLKSVFEKVQPYRANFIVGYEAR